MAPKLCLCLLLTIYAGFLNRIEGKVSALIVFGDSSVDAGNNNHIATIARSNFEPYGRDFRGGRATGRFSNGKVPTDFISEALGLKPLVPAYLDPGFNISDFATGVCFASAGSGYDNATSDVLSVISLSKELEYYKEYQKHLRLYLGNKEANTRIKAALHLMSLGTNDFLENYYTNPGGRRSQYNVDEYQGFPVSIARRFIRQLYAMGARRVSLGGLPPMGCLPLERVTNFFSGDDCNEIYNIVARDFNDKLKTLTGNLNKELPGIKVVFSNPYDTLFQLIQNPTSHGFDVASVGCCATGTYEMGYICDVNGELTCSDATKYVFWDAFHPTEKANKIIADDVVKNVLHVFM